VKEHRKWYSISFISLLKAIVYIGIPFYYILPLLIVSYSMVLGHTVYVNTNPPCLVVYNEKMVPKGAAAGAMGYVVYVQPSLYNDPISHHHEYEHVRQYWRSAGLAKFFYIYSTKHRFLFEYEAYLEGLKYSNNLEDDLYASAVGLSHPSYKLGITPELAYLLLQNGINKHRGIE